MVIVLKKNSTPEQVGKLRSFLTQRSFKLNEVKGEEDTIIAAVGRVSMDIREVELLDGVSKVIPISKPFKMASREFKNDNTVVEIKNSRSQIIRIGGSRVCIIAGPSAVESREQILEIARNVASSGAALLRGGAFMPRSSPYSFQGLGEEALKYLKEAGEKYGLPVVSEINSESLIPMMKDYVDVFQISSRSMQDFDLLKKVGAAGKPVILRRSYTATLEEFLMSAEYLLSSGTENVILCERGIRTFEHSTTDTLDLSSVPVLRSLTHLPIIVDPTASGLRDKVPSMALASIACGADGISIGVHDNPEQALCDGAKSVLPSVFDKIVHDVEAIAPVIGKAVVHIMEQPSEKQRQSSSDDRKTVCVYSGKAGAYAQQAIERYFDRDVESRPLNSFAAVFEAVTDGKAEFGMIPIENSLNGSIYQNYDNFSRFEDVEICGAVTLNIRHCLLGIKGGSIDGIKNVYSHPQGFGQSRAFLEKHPGWNLVDCTSTSDAAQFVSEKEEAVNAAIASTVTAGIYGLSVLAEDIEDDPSNFTRFVVITARNPEKKKVLLNIKDNMASFIFTTKNEAGALNRTLSVIGQQGFNLSRLESRPIRGQLWKSWFYADVELPEENAGECALSLLRLMKETAEEVRLLGIYSERK